MTLLIDGYNLLHVTGILAKNLGPGSLERARRALLNSLASSLGDAQRRETTVVFDAANAPPGLPPVQSHRGIVVRYAAGYEDADALLEELIRKDSAPRRLTVVSSDHRVQRAARRRRANPVDADAWFEQLRRSRSEALPPASPSGSKPEAPATPEEIERWMRIFGDRPLDSDDAPAAEPDRDPHPADPPPPADNSDADAYGPFPPGYGEDLLRDEE